MQGARVLILNGKFKGEEGVCLSKDTTGGWAVSPDEAMKFYLARLNVSSLCSSIYQEIRAAINCRSSAFVSS